jgi:hypothetical protein
MGQTEKENFQRGGEIATIWYRMFPDLSMGLVGLL